ncbi:vWA domain-containing protein [uncultured Draconibacterium sp.]|uniref:vWA domain-containing protein n=1 Tax=uncultured Draconibacterium sp. TaxID=1573823 RepID=UPI003217DBB3
MSNIQKHQQNTAGLSLKDKLKGLSDMTKGKNSALQKVELPRLFYQLVIFVLDGSGSMHGLGKTGKTKGEEVAEIIHPVIKRLKESKNKNSFDISAWVYGTQNKQILNSESVEKINSNTSFNPNDSDVGATTYIADCLKNVGEHADNYLYTHKGKNAQVLVILLSDGAIHDIAKATPIAESLIQNPKITVSSAFLETQGLGESYLTNCQDKMRAITSTSNLSVDHFFTSTVDPEAIRKHMIKSISTVSKID